MPNVLQPVLGLAGLVFLVIFLRAFGRVITGPGDDNPIALLFLFGAALALIPSWGLVRALRGLNVRDGKLWLVAAVTATIVLALLYSLPVF